MIDHQFSFVFHLANTSDHGFDTQTGHIADLLAR
jgi:hypothetical protein